MCISRLLSFFKFGIVTKLSKPNCRHLYFVGAANAGSNDMKYPVLLLKSVQKMAEDFHSLLTDKDKKKLAGFMRKLGFDDIAATLYDLPEESERKVRIVRSNELGFKLFPSQYLITRR